MKTTKTNRNSLKPLFRRGWGVLLLLSLISCRQEVEIPGPEGGNVGQPEYTGYAGFFLLNEGNMGSNKATLDYYDYTTAQYTRNVYAAANPSAVMELGDAGNDLKLYGGRLYAVLNGSGKVEVMRLNHVDSIPYPLPRRIGQVDIPNCRYIAFHEGYAYVTSYAGPVDIDQRQQGYVAKVDTATLQIVAECVVGYQPDELAVADGKIYVANSGGYLYPDYDNTLSVIDLATFEEEKRIPVAPNLHRVRADRHGQLWVTSRGNYADQPARLLRLDPATATVTDTLDLAVSNLCLAGDSLYYCGQDWSGGATTPTNGYGIIDVRTARPVTARLITDGTEVESPYGIMVHPTTRDVYLTDARSYTVPGMIYCFATDGHKAWSYPTGDVPAHFALVPRQGE